MNTFTRKFWSSSIKKKMILSYLAVLLLPSLYIGYSTYRSAGSEMKSQLVDSATESVNTVNDIVTGSLTAKFSDLAYYANSTSGTDAAQGMMDGGKNLQESLSQYVKTHYDVLDVYTVSDDGVSRHGAENAKSDTDERKKQGYIDALKNPGKTIVSTVFQTPEGQSSVSITRGLSDGKGIIGIDLNLDSLAALADLKVGKEGYVIMLDSGHHYIVHPGYDDIGQEEKGDFINSMYAGESGEFSYTYNNQSKKMIFATNSLTGWKIGGTIFNKEINGASRQIGLTTLWVILSAVVLGGLLIVWVIRSILKPIIKLKQSTYRIGQGYLNEQLKIDSRDEVGELADNFQRMVDNLRDTIVMVRNTSEGLSLSAEQLAMGAEQSKTSITQVTEAIQEVASGGEKQVESMEAGAQNVRNLTEEVTQIANEIGEVHMMMNVTSQLAQEGNEAIATTTNKMGSIHVHVDDLGQVITGLSERTEEIGSIVSVMAGIAQQTNLLALNASIEAARAGEQGRGFAVVAAEVRKLAENSAEFADQIRSLITRVTEEMTGARSSMAYVSTSVTDGIKAAQTSETAFNHILVTVQGLAQSIQSSSDKLQRMKEEAGSVDEAISLVQLLSRDNARNTETISASAEEQLALAQEVASSTEELKNKADELNNLISRFTIE
ncbi:methyl-accepting chemotaxis protein [Paenibacillus pinistramenti]|uniref:methyl-accepting chemotaxis protein n=1 Tax=Paenibacillus pinistramenti TaxID=1768003 RepID=UPI0011088741|nr:methyl-accepting chemotaxis protein [Paenibacillus pinistramenti]